MTISLLEDSYISFINLPHRRDRLAWMIEQLARVGISAVRTPGMSPSEYRGDPARIRTMLSRPQKGAIGCYFSQMKVMQTAKEMGRHAFVMEDDLIFCGDFYHRLRHLEKFVSCHPWDVIWFGGTFHINPPWWHKTTLGRDAEQTDDPRVMRTYGAFSTHAYLVNRESLSRILAWHEELLPISIGIDWSFIQMEPTLHTYAYVPGCIIQRDNQSDIGRGWTVFSNFRRLGPYWYQEYLDEFDPEKFDWHEATRRKPKTHEEDTLPERDR